MTTQGNLFIGLMSGTSMDGVDATLVAIDQTQTQHLCHVHLPYPSGLLKRLRRLANPGNLEIDLMGSVDIEVAQVFAEATSQLLTLSGCTSDKILAIGSHGQTIRHRPNINSSAQSHGFSLQIGDPNTLATITGIPVVADFRRKDMALGGQGAPLAPGFHLAAINDDKRDQVVLNLGGIANITFLPKNASQNVNSVLGFDTGPANTLLDAWYQRHNQADFDRNGDWAKSGVCYQPLLEKLLADPYFALLPPKSTGREYFSIDWLDASLQEFSILPTEDVQATLSDLTVKSICMQIRELGRIDSVHVCGGGVFNAHLLQGLSDSLPSTEVAPSSTVGIDPMHIEAMAFAWLAYQYCHKLPGNLPSVTGARRTAVLGGLYLPN